MASLQDIYNRLFDGEKLVIKFASKREYDNLRIQLTKKQSLHVTLQISTDSLCSSYDAATQSGTFWIGERRSGHLKDFEILE